MEQDAVPREIEFQEGKSQEDGEDPSLESVKKATGRDLRRAEEEEASAPYEGEGKTGLGPTSTDEVELSASGAPSDEVGRGQPKEGQNQGKDAKGRNRGNTQSQESDDYGRR